MNKDDFLCILLLMFLFFVACFAPDLYNPKYL